MFYAVVPCLSIRDFSNEASAVRLEVLLVYNQVICHMPKNLCTWLHLTLHRFKRVALLYEALGQVIHMQRLSRSTSVVQCDLKVPASRPERSTDCVGYNGARRIYARLDLCCRCQPLSRLCKTSSNEPIGCGLTVGWEAEWEASRYVYDPTRDVLIQVA